MTSLQLTAIDKLKPSPFEVQAERRAHYDKAQLQELAGNIKAIGIVQPIVARPVDGHLEIVAGERRWMAAQAAGLDQVPVWVRELSDQEALEVQLVENLQREGLHELAEAEGYETLMKQHGYDIEQLVAKVGRSRSYVYARLKLLALCKEARTAFYEGKISASIALLIARIPVEKLQKDALKQITNAWGGDVMTYRQAAEYIQREYMLRLADAPFDTGDPDLYAAAGPCGSCPKRTGNQAELFGDVKSADICTDPLCFNIKRAAHADQLIQNAKGKGQPVLAGTQAKQLIVWENDHDFQLKHASGYAKLGDTCYDDPKYRSYKQILGKDAPTTVMRTPGGKVVEVVAIADVRKALKEKGVKVANTRTSSNPQVAAAERKRRSELKYRQALYEAVREKLSGDIHIEDLRIIAEAFYEGVWHEGQKKIIETWEWQLDDATEKKLKRTPYKRRDYTEAMVKKQLSTMRMDTLMMFLMDCALVPDLVIFSDNDKPDLLLRVAERYKVDAAQIRKDVAEEAKLAPKKAAAKPAKKKAARKPK